MRAERALAAVAGLALVSPGTRWVAGVLDHQPTLCPLQLALGVPCPSCGGTRAALHLLAGDPIGALSFNAGATVFMATIAVLVMSGTIRVTQFFGVDNDDAVSSHALNAVP